MRCALAERQSAARSAATVQNFAPVARTLAAAVGFLPAVILIDPPEIRARQLKERPVMYRHEVVLKWGVEWVVGLMVGD